MGTGGNFEDTLDLYVDKHTEQTSVVAKGPAYGKGVVEMCVWIIQKKLGSESDAAATQITTYPGRGGLSQGKDSKGDPTWELRVLQKSTNPLVAGPATAMAIALFQDDNGEEQTRFWAQSVELVKKP
jgi:hypothetical protein